MSDLFAPVKMGSLRLKNRIFMAPLTRSRADQAGVPGHLAAKYYAQRASAGLIISEATTISKQGVGFINTPGIYTEEQVAKWKTVTDAVHAEGGVIFCQLWHVGRVSHVSLLPEGEQPVAPSAIKAQAQTFTKNGMEDVSEPRALATDEIKRIVQDYQNAAIAAKKAGFDGVELHAANGYLLDQFIRDSTNQRSDEYGGSIEDRARFLLEVFDAVAEVWSAERMGVRFAPTLTFNDIQDSDPVATYGYIFAELDKRKAAYLHLCEGVTGFMDSIEDDRKILDALRQKWQGFYIVNGGFDREGGQQAVATDYAHAVAYGRPFIANPDLPERFKQNAPLNEPDDSSFYGGDHRGYTDYPLLSDS